jgi:hypothetical protein
MHGRNPQVLSLHYLTHERKQTIPELMAVAKAQPKTTTTNLIRQRIESGGDRFWRFSDFADLPPAAVAQALSRLTLAKQLRRLSRGIYYRPRHTTFGESLPNPAKLQELAKEKAPIFPAGLAAANLLGFTTQIGNRTELATTAASLPRKLVGEETVIHTHRPSAWTRLGREDAALLDFLRRTGDTSELTQQETTRRTLAILATEDCLSRIEAVAPTEPPRVRALLGALAETLKAAPATLELLRNSLNPLSRFDFGGFAGLPTARAWQAKASGTR